MSNTISEEELELIYQFALELARGAGRILLDGIDKRCAGGAAAAGEEQVEKMNAVDIVTQTDHGMSDRHISPLSDGTERLDAARSSRHMGVNTVAD